MFKKKVFMMAVFSLLIFVSCSRLSVNLSITPAADHGSLLVIDEANQVLNQVNLNTGNVSFYSVAGPAANQIIVDGNYAYVVVSSSHDVMKFDLQNGGAPVIKNWYDTPNPYAMAIDESNLYVIMSSGNSLSVLDKSNLSNKTNILLNETGGVQPYAIADDSNNIYIGTSVGYLAYGDSGNYTNSQVMVIAKSNYALITNISVWTNPVNFAISGGHLYIAAASQYNGTGALQDLTLSDMTVSNISVFNGKAPAYVKVNNGNLYVIDGTFGGNGGIWKMNLADGSTNLSLSGKNLKGIAFSGASVFVSEAYGGNTVYVLDASTWTQVSSYAGTGGGDMAFY